MLLKEIRLQTKHLSALYHFYKDVLHLKVSQSNTETIAIVAGQTTLIFEATDDTANPFYHFAFNIPANKIEEALQWLQGKVELLWMEEYKSYIANFTNWHARSLYFIDPAGNILELIARFDLNDNASDPFSAEQIRNISEIGLVFNNREFDEHVNKLLYNFQLQYFSKQPPMKHFRATGDDEGLFIVVPQHRNWFPANTPCGIFSLSVKFKNNNREHHLQL